MCYQMRMDKKLTIEEAYELAAHRAKVEALTDLLAGKVLMKDGLPFSGKTRLITPEQRDVLLG